MNEDIKKINYFQIWLAFESAVCFHSKEGYHYGHKQEAICERLSKSLRDLISLAPVVTKDHNSIACICVVFFCTWFTFKSVLLESHPFLLVLVKPFFQSVANLRPKQKHLLLIYPVVLVNLRLHWEAYAKIMFSLQAVLLKEL